MRIVARAPGKLVVLGEYAVLDGAPALVMAVDRYCRATLEPSGEGACRLSMRAAQAQHVECASGDPTGVALVDLVTDGARTLVPAWRAELDSRELYAGRTKVGLGSSAAALCAWSEAWAAYLQYHGVPRPDLGLEQSIALHNASQHGAGSGLDVAASMLGGLVSFRLECGSFHHAGVVRLPKGVAFAGIFAGRSASTPGLVARYRAWQAECPRMAADFERRLRQIAEAGAAAAAEGDADALVRAVDAYGRGLGELGHAMGTDIVTMEHRAVEAVAKRFGVAYKVSGAGGGDLGLALSTDAEALGEFMRVIGRDFTVLDLAIDPHGLVIEEPAR